MGGEKHPVSYAEHEKIEKVTGSRDDKVATKVGDDSPWKIWYFPATSLSSRPERTRIFWNLALDMATYAAFVKESRIKIANATKLNRKSGVA